MKATLGAVGLIVAALFSLPSSAAPAHHDAPLPPAQEAARQRLLDAARAALSRGEPDAALVPLESASGMAHAADAEMLQLQMQLQGGRFRQALAFAAHSAAAHRDEPEARALHLWLLALSGQVDYVKQRLTPGDVGDDRLSGLLAGLETPSPLAGLPPSPLPHGVEVPDTARAVATGLILDGGRLAVVPAQAVRGGDALWLRNGVGRASRAYPIAEDPALAALGLARLRIDPPLRPSNAADPLSRAPRAPFAGSPASRIGMPRLDTSAPSWPVMQSGFTGRVDRNGVQSLGWPAGVVLSGGPVFDTAGRLAGLAVPTADGGTERLIPAATLEGLQVLPIRADAHAVTPDQVYEAALFHVAQLLR